jgi:hypothetical protein
MESLGESEKKDILKLYTLCHELSDFFKQRIVSNLKKLADEIEEIGKELANSQLTETRKSLLIGQRLKLVDLSTRHLQLLAEYEQ